MATNSIEARVIAKAQQVGIDLSSSSSENIISDIAAQLGMDPEQYNIYDIEAKLDEILGNNRGNNEYHFSEDDSVIEDENSVESIQDVDESDNYNEQQNDRSIEDQKAEDESQKHNKYKNNQEANEETNLYESRNYRKSQYNQVNNRDIKQAAESVKAGDEAAKDAAKNVAADKAKEKATESAAKQVAKKGAEEAVKSNAAKAGTAALTKNPYFWIAIGVIVLLLICIIFVVVIIGSSEEREEMYGSGLYPYVEMEFSDKVVYRHNGVDTTLDLEDYVAGVIYCEVSDLQGSDEFLKAAAIAARSNAQYQMKHLGYITKNTQCYKTNAKYTDKGKKFHDIADDTAGIVLTTEKDGKHSFYYAFYDMIAFKESCGGSETADSFILCQKQVELPKQWIYDNSWLNEYHARKLSNNSSHGKGMSQSGGYYLGKVKGYSAKQILNLFYPDAQIISLYPVYSGSVNSNVAVTNVPKTKGEPTCITTNMKSFLSNHGTDIKTVNMELLSEVKKAGVGTRQGVVAAATYSINKIASYGKKIPYWYGGYWNEITKSYGIDKSWGSPRRKTVDFGDSKTTYEYYGLDCASFVRWAFKNGGVSSCSTANEKSCEHIGATSFLFKKNAPKYEVTDTAHYVGRPGDVLAKKGKTKSKHVMLIVGVKFNGNASNSSYLIAHAGGYSDDTNIVIFEDKFTDLTNYKVVDMQWYYDNRKIQNFEQKFINYVNSNY